MLFIKLWLLGIIVSIITGFFIRKKLNNVSCIVNGRRYLKGKIHIGWVWLPMILSFALLAGMPSGYILMTIIKYLAYDIILVILISIIAMIIMIFFTFSVSAFFMGMEIIIDYFCYEQQLICLSIIIVTTLIWAFCFFI